MTAHDPRRPEPIAGLRSLAERYQVFLVDQFGVLHDGARPYPGAVEALLRLKQTRKRVVLLSNSGRRAAANEARMLRLGFEPGSWDLFVTSGEVAWQMFRRGGHDLKRGARCLLIAREGDRSAVEGLDVTLAVSGHDADVVLLSGSEGDRYPLQHYRDLLAPAARRGLACVCTNPDKVMLTGAGPCFGAGRIAELYEEMGGKVAWIGKPFPEIYRFALAQVGNPKPGTVVCIGDSVEHDVKGGQGLGLAVALVRSGIMAGKKDQDVQALYRAHAAIPEHVVPRFAW